MGFNPESYIRILLGAMVGVLFVWVGVTGRLGSILGAMITPDFMIAGQETFGASQSPGGSTPNPTIPPGGKANIDQIAQFAYNAGIHTQNPLAIATAIALAESGGNVTAYNGGNPPGAESSCGLWQINLLAHPSYTKTEMFDPVQNAAAMYAISSQGTNWNPWSTYTNGAYTNYLAQAQTAAQGIITGSGGAH